MSGDLTFAVLEFYSRDSFQPTETLLRSLTGMGLELGRFFARRGGELRPQELTARERQICNWPRMACRERRSRSSSHSVL